MSSDNRAARVRRIARLDYAFRHFNGGRLPMFRCYIDDEYVLSVQPCDGTPETALDILRTQIARSERSGKFVVVTLAEGSADTLIKNVPTFYQGVTMWREEL